MTMSLKCAALPDGGRAAATRGLRRALRALVALVALGAGCSNPGVENGAAAIPERVGTGKAAIAVPPVPPIRIVSGKSPPPDPELFRRAKSIALVAHEAMPYVAQARYCWPSFRFRGSVDPFDKRLADQALRNTDLTLPPRCTPEPSAVTEFVARSAGSGRGPVAPATAMESFLGVMGYADVAAAGCSGSLRGEKGRVLRRRWRSDVRIQRTGNPVIDGAFATILADPRFRAAMGNIKVALVSERPNVLIVPRLPDICLEPGRPCDAQRQSTTCRRSPEGEAREVLARRASGGRTGYFPDANEFYKDRPIGLGGGFTVGDGQTITGAVCTGLNYSYEGPPTRAPGTPEQAIAAGCLLRALGIAGEQSPMTPFIKMRRPQTLKLTDFDAETATFSATAFRILDLIYRESREEG